MLVFGGGVGQAPWQWGWRSLSHGSPRATVPVCLPPYRPASWRSSRCWPIPSAAACTVWSAASTRSAATRRPAPWASPGPGRLPPGQARRGRAAPRPLPGAAGPAAAGRASPEGVRAVRPAGRHHHPGAPLRPRRGDPAGRHRRGDRGRAAAGGRDPHRHGQGSRARRRLPPGARARTTRSRARADRRHRGARGARLRAAPPRPVHRRAPQLPVPHAGPQGPEVICAINRSLLEGLLRGLGDQRVEAVLAPRPDACCVELRAPRSR
jgi:hypothetical protein